MILFMIQAALLAIPITWTEAYVDTGPIQVSKEYATEHHIKGTPIKRTFTISFATGIPVLKEIHDVYAKAVQLIHWRESRNGRDPRCKRGMVGAAGEQGEYQITPIWVADIHRLFSIRIDPFDTAGCRMAINRWLRYWEPKTNARSVGDMAELYRRGPTGFRRWKRRRVK